MLFLPGNHWVSNTELSHVRYHIKIIFRFLVHWGVDINAADSDGWTPLHCAASCNSVQMVKFLVENGAQIFAETYSDNETGKIETVIFFQLNHI